MSKINYKEYEQLVEEIKKLSQKKNADYGCDSLISFGNLGLLIRISDKIDRLKNIYNKNDISEILISDETIEDTLKDLINYAYYMLLQSRGKLIDET